MASQSTSTVLGQALRRLPKLAPRRSTELREACASALEKIEGAGGQLATSGAADEFFRPFELACVARSGKLAEAALDALQHLIAHGHLRGSRGYTAPLFGPHANRAGENGETSRMRRRDSVLGDTTVRKSQADTIVETVCACFEIADEAVHLQVVRVLLTAFSAKTFPLHEGALLLAVRTCYNTFLVSKSANNRTTARAALTQIISNVFKRMEKAEGAAGTSLSLEHDNEPDRSAAVHSDAASAAEEDGGGERGKGDGNGNGSAVSHEEDTMDMEAYLQGLVGKMTSDAAAIASGRKTVEQALNEGYTAYDLARWRMRRSLENDRNDDLEPLSPRDKSVLRNVYERDAFLLFRALCKLSMKAMPDGALADSVAMRSRVLSLELLDGIVASPGSLLLSHVRFVQAIRQYLCISVLKNGMSPIPVVCKHACRIIVALVQHYRAHLKLEIGVFFKDIFLRILASSHAIFQQKIVVLEALTEIFRDPHLVVGIFVNYDCDLEGVDAFQNAVNHLSRAVQGWHDDAAAVVSQQQAMALRSYALEGLVAALQALSKWSRRVADSPPASESAVIDYVRLARQRRPTVASESDSKSTDVPALAAAAAAATVGSGAQPDVQLAASDAETIPLRGGEAGAQMSPRRPSAAGDRGAVSGAEGGVGGGGHAPGSAIDSAADGVGRQKLVKQQLEEGKRLFNFKPARGIRFLVDQRHIEHEPVSIALWLHSSEGLSKTKIGEYLGEGDEFNVSVLYAYVDQLSFAGMSFDSALRHFLSGFRLPGEAQKIDRMMEKFAERYCAENPGAFQSADTAYVLAYAIIMLNTDAHNPMVKRKMTKDDFVRNNTKYNEYDTLEREFLEELYDNIVTNEIKLEDDDFAASNGGGAGSSDLVGLHATASLRQRQQLFLRESEVLLRESQQLLRRRARSQADFAEADDGELAHLMFDLICWPALAALSTTVEESDDNDVVRLCMTGFESCIRVAAVFGMATARDAFISALVKFTTLQTVRQARPKNIEAIRVLLRVAERLGNFLGPAWSDVLSCVSQLERLQLVGAGVKDAGGLPAAQAAAARYHRRERSVTGFLGLPSGQQGSLADIQEAQALSVAARVDPGSVERLFVNSYRLNDEAIVAFVRALCNVSLEELNVEGSPRIFSLQKIVEIAHDNMGRIRVVWSRMWAELGNHFETAGCLPHATTALYAVDSLRQLAMKFLEKAELGNFQFQRDFLKPFEHVMTHNRDPEIREFIVRALSQIVLSRGANIRSGWRRIFAALSAAAEAGPASLVRLGYGVLEGIAKDHALQSADTFVECVNCATVYALSTFDEEVSLAALDRVRACARRLAAGAVPRARPDAGAAGSPSGPGRAAVASSGTSSPLASVAEEGAGRTALGTGASRAETRRARGAFGLLRGGRRSPPLASSSARQSGTAKGRAASVCLGSSLPAAVHFTDAQEDVRVWWPVLTGFSRAIVDDRLAPRTRALEALFETLRSHGSGFSPSLWGLVFRGVLIPIFDDVHHARESELLAAESDWLRTTCYSALNLLVELFARVFDTASFLLSDILALISACICQENEGVAGIGVHCLSRLVADCASHLRPVHWGAVCKAAAKCLLATLPHELGRTAVVDSTTGRVVAEKSAQPAHADSGHRPQAGSGDDDATQVLVSVTVVRDSGRSGSESERAVVDVQLLERDAAVADVSDREHLSALTESDFRGARSKCITQLVLLQALHDVFFDNYKNLSAENVLEIHRAVAESFMFAHTFNSDMDLRISLMKAGLLSHVPNLLKQEANSVSLLLHMNFRLFSKGEMSKGEDAYELAGESIRTVARELLESYGSKVQLPTSAVEAHRELAALTPVIVQLLQALTELTAAQFSGFRQELCSCIFGLVLAPDPDVRAGVHKLLERQIAPYVLSGV